MRGSRDRIITSHVGSLPRPDALIEANAKRGADAGTGERAFQDLLSQSVTGVVRQQKDAGIDIPNDGEFGKAMGERVNFRAWLSYSFNRLSGLETLDKQAPPRPSGPHDLVLQGLVKRRDRTKFLAAYTDPASGISIGRDFVRPVCTGPVKYIGQDAIAADIAHFKAALEANGIAEGFMTSIAPGSASRLSNPLLQDR